MASGLKFYVYRDVLGISSHSGVYKVCRHQNIYAIILGFILNIFHLMSSQSHRFFVYLFLFQRVFLFYFINFSVFNPLECILTCRHLFVL